MRLAAEPAAAVPPVRARGGEGELAEQAVAARGLTADLRDEDVAPRHTIPPVCRTERLAVAADRVLYRALVAKSLCQHGVSLDRTRIEITLRRDLDTVLVGHVLVAGLRSVVGLLRFLVHLADRVQARVVSDAHVRPTLS